MGLCLSECAIDIEVLADLKRLWAQEGCPHPEKPDSDKEKTDAWRGTGPRPTVRGSELDVARDRPSPYGRRNDFVHPTGARKERNDAWRGTGPRPTVRGSELDVARDRPSPYGRRNDFVNPTVARGPVPRDRPTWRTPARVPPTRLPPATKYVQLALSPLQG